jgi:hypothetical protein
MELYSRWPMKQKQCLSFNKIAVVTIPRLWLKITLKLGHPQMAMLSYSLLSDSLNTEVPSSQPPRAFIKATIYLHKYFASHPLPGGCHKFCLFIKWLKDGYFKAKIRLLFVCLLVWLLPSEIIHEHLKTLFKRKVLKSYCCYVFYQCCGKIQKESIQRKENTL